VWPQGTREAGALELVLALHPSVDHHQADLVPQFETAPAAHGRMIARDDWKRSLKTRFLNILAMRTRWVPKGPAWAGLAVLDRAARKLRERFEEVMRVRKYPIRQVENVAGLSFSYHSVTYHAREPNRHNLLL